MNYPTKVKIEDKEYPINTDFRVAIECDNIAKSDDIETKKKALKEYEVLTKNKRVHENTDKYYIHYNYTDNKWSYSVFSKIYRQGIITNCFFKTEEFTRKVIKEYGERIKTLLNKKYRR